MEGVGTFDVKVFVEVFGDALALRSPAFVEGTFTANVERYSFETLNVTTLLFFKDLLGCVGSATGGVDIFDSELGTRRVAVAAFGGPGISLNGVLERGLN